MGIGSQISALIQEYGQDVTLWSQAEDCFSQGKAILQYVKGTDSQYGMTVLGEENKQRLLYLGLACEKISALGDWVLWEGKKYLVISAHPVYVGTTMAYWRGILKEMGQECDWEGGEQVDADGF